MKKKSLLTNKVFLIEFIIYNLPPLNKNFLKKC